MLIECVSSGEKASSARNNQQAKRRRDIRALRGKAIIMSRIFVNCQETQRDAWPISGIEIWRANHRAHRRQMPIEKGMCALPSKAGVDEISGCEANRRKRHRTPIIAFGVLLAATYSRGLASRRRPAKSGRHSPKRPAAALKIA